MNHGLVSLEKLIPGYGFPPDPPKPPPKKQVAKVIGDPTREPVNRQAALIITRAHYLELPPMPPAAPPLGELQQLREQVEKLKSANQAMQSEIASLKRKLDRKPEPKTVIKIIEKTVNIKQNDSKTALLERIQSL